jgi:sigma-E factor negative regulatory protein RseA
MQERISAMMDDQANSQEVDDLLQQLAQDDSLREQWETYQLVGDVLRGHVQGDIRARVSAFLASEPAHSVPVARSHSSRPNRWAMSLAASLAAIAMVGGLALHLGVLLPSESASQVAGLEQSPAVSSTAQSMSNARSGSGAKASGEEPPQTSAMQEYRLAHEQVSSAPMMSSIAGYARLVVSEGVAR